MEATYKRKSCLRRGFWRGKAYQRDELIGGVARARKIIFFLGAQPGDKNFQQINAVFLC